MAEATEAETKEFRRWTRELDAANKRFKDWKDEAQKLYKRYRAAEKKLNAWNMLWANTETLCPAIYNSTPRPDVRRRFRDADPLGKATSEALKRCLEVSLDHYTFQDSMEFDTLDMILVGRGLSRVRYIPSIEELPPRKQPRPAKDVDEVSEEPGATDPEEQVAYEYACVEHVDWEDFRHGYGRVWDEVQWEGFRTKLNKADAGKKFGEEAVKDIKFDQKVEESDNEGGQADQKPDSVSEFWEIWDKASKRVFFLNQGCQRLLYPTDNPKGEPPLDFENFFPNPKPLRCVLDSSSLEPIPHYRFYEQQANEVDRLSRRINKIVDALKLRGIYDSTVSELADLMTGQDNDLIASSNAAQWRQYGGIEKAIWMMPIEKAAQVLAALYDARDRAVAAVYEITGVSDIMRGQSDASETLGAQQLKANFGGQRVKRMQREVQRYCRDITRLMAEIISEKFSQETIAEMSGLKLPTEAQKQMAKAQAALMNQQPPADLMSLPTWEDVIGLLRSDQMRQYRIDIETDSTVAAHIEADMAGLRDVLTGITQFWAAAGPAVQAGAVPIDAIKAITLAITRRASLGLEVEDALDKIQAPQQTNQDPLEQERLQLEREKIGAEKERAAAEVKKTQMESVYAEKEHEARMQELAMKAAIAAQEHAATMREMALQAAMPQPAPTESIQ